MKNTMTFSSFIDQWPESRKNQFSYEGMRALYDYLTDYEDSTGEDMEYDPVAFCCEFTEYENLKELQRDYSTIETIEDIQDNTIYIPIYSTDGHEMDNFIIQSY